MSNHRRRPGVRGSEFVRRDQTSWRSPRSGSPGSPGLNGSPRTGRRDRREPEQLQQPPSLSSSDHESYVEYLNRKWAAVQQKANEHPGTVTYWKSSDLKSGEPVPIFDVDRFFIERLITKKQATSSPPHSHNPYQHHQPNMDSGTPDW